MRLLILLLFFNYSYSQNSSNLLDLIENTYKEDGIVILAVMNGSFFFMKDLIDQLSIDFEYDFIFWINY